MTIYRVIPTNDIELVPTGKGDGKVTVNILTGQAHIRQKIATHLRFFLGEWFRDKRQGMPYFQDVFVRNPDIELIRAVYIQAIELVGGVARVERLTPTFDRVARNLAIDFDARLTTGELLSVRQPDPLFIIGVQPGAA